MQDMMWLALIATAIAAFVFVFYFNVKKRGLKQGQGLRVYSPSPVERAIPGNSGAGSPRMFTRSEIKQACVDNLLFAVPEQVFFKDLESRFVLVSKGHADMFGTTADEVVGKTDFDFFSEKHAREAYNDEQEIIRTGQPKIGMEERQTWPDRPDDFMVCSKYPL